MKQKEERQIISDLNRDIAIQSTACGRNCRNVVYAIVGVTWGFLLKEECQWNKYLLSLIMIIGIFYLIIETWRYYSTAKRARELYEKSSRLDDETIDQEMTRQSDWAFSVLYKQMWFCAVMAILLIIYVVFRYIL